MSGAPDEQSRKVVQQAFSTPSWGSGCCNWMALSMYITPFWGQMPDQRASGRAGFVAIVDTALTLMFCTPAVDKPNKFIRGVRNAGVFIAVPPSSATRTPLAVSIGSL